MKLQDLPQDFTPEQFMALDKESLDAVPYTLKKWFCQCKSCQNGTTVRDYGLERYYFLHRNSKAAAKNTHDYWMGMGNIWLCGKHNKLFKRLEKSFDIQSIWGKLIDWDKQKIADTPEGNGTALGAVEKIEQSTEK